MMTTLDKREAALEEKFHHDQELLFKAIAKRNKMFGLWLAEQLNLSPEEAQAYARKMVEIGMESADETAVLARAVADLSVADVDLSEARLIKELEKFLVLAKKAVLEG